MVVGAAIECSLTRHGPVKSENGFVIQYNTIQYNTIQYNTIQYNTIQNCYCAEILEDPSSSGSSFHRVGVVTKKIPVSTFVLTLGTTN